jgi:hypothetical protein
MTDKSSGKKLELEDQEEEEKKRRKTLRKKTTTKHDKNKRTDIHTKMEKNYKRL